MSKIHLGIRPYICDKCGISYCDEPELRMHLARHAESKPYSCNFCSYSTFQKGSLKCKCTCSSIILSLWYIVIIIIIFVLFFLVPLVVKIPRVKRYKMS